MFERPKLNQKGQVSSAVIALVTTFGIAIVIAILMVTVASKTYTTTVHTYTIPNFGAAQDANNIGADINATLENSFEAYNQATQNLPLLAIILVAAVVLSVIAGFMMYTNGGASGGGIL